MAADLIDYKVQRKVTSFKRKQASGSATNRKPMNPLAPRYWQNASSTLMHQAYLIPASMMTTTTMIMKMMTYLPVVMTEEPEKQRPSQRRR